MPKHTVEKPDFFEDELDIETKESKIEPEVGLKMAYGSMKKGYIPTIIKNGFDWYLVRHRGKAVYLPKYLL